MSPEENETSIFVVIADVWDECARQWMPGRRVPTVYSVKHVVESLIRPGKPAAIVKSEALAMLSADTLVDLQHVRASSIRT